MLIGEFAHSLDDKNRLSLPAKFRQEMGKKVILARGLDHSVTIFTVKEWGKIAEKLSDYSMFQADNRNFNRFMFSGAVEVTIDSIGRVLVPDFLKEWGNLGARVAIIGVQNRAEIWNENVWRERKTAVENQAEALAEILGQAGII